MTRWVSYGCSCTDFLIVAGDNYEELIERYADATGHAPGVSVQGFWFLAVQAQV